MNGQQTSTGLHTSIQSNGDHCYSGDPKKSDCTAASDPIEKRKVHLNMCRAKQCSAVPGGQASLTRVQKSLARNSPCVNGFILFFGEFEEFNLHWSSRHLRELMRLKASNGRTGPIHHDKDSTNLMWYVLSDTNIGRTC